jgi:hypothetical protein
MTPVVVFWVFLAAIAAWGSAYFAMGDPRSTSWMKIAFAAVPLFGFLLMVAGLNWQIDVGEGLLAYAMGLFFWAMATIGAPLCLGSLIGTLFGMYRGRSRSSRRGSFD